MDHFYSYGFAFPVGLTYPFRPFSHSSYDSFTPILQVWNSVDTGKAIIYGTKNHLTQNFVVNLAWIIGGSIALLSVAAYKRKQQDKQEYNERVEKVENAREEKKEQRQDETGARERQASEAETAAESDSSSDATRRV